MESGTGVVVSRLASSAPRDFSYPGRDFSSPHAADRRGGRSRRWPFSAPPPATCPAAAHLPRVLPPSLPAMEDDDDVAARAALALAIAAAGGAAQATGAAGGGAAQAMATPQPARRPRHGQAARPGPEAHRDSRPGAQRARWPGAHAKGSARGAQATASVRAYVHRPS